MSQYFFIYKNHEIMYGLDKPTGGYYWVEFASDENGNEDISRDKYGITLTSLLEYLDIHGEIPNVKSLVSDYANSPEPSPMQIKVSKNFGINVMEKLSFVLKDLSGNFNFIPVEFGD